MAPIEIGKTRRLARLFRKNGRILIIPMENGTPLDKFDSIARDVKAGGADAIMTTFGQARQYAADLVDIPIVITINYGDADLNYALEYVREAVSLGAEAVKVHFFGPMKDFPLLQLQKLSIECKSHQLPLLLEPMPMSDYAENGGQQLTDCKVIGDAVNLAVAIGADVIKTNYTGSAVSFKQVTTGCPVPVIIAGGPKLTNEKTLEMIKGAIEGGASGGAIGRNITTHADPLKITKAIAKIIHENASVTEALKELN
jgi:fructose-bisphosphate aldolase/2-amino-3,7-dideoxy-D-threo-hept-6-ulosonate synthase